MPEGVVDRLRQAVAEYDGAGSRLRQGCAGAHILSLVRELLAEVDRPAGSCTCLPLVTCDNCAERAWAEPLGSTIPGVNGSVLPG